MSRPICTHPNHLGPSIWRLVHTLANTAAMLRSVLPCRSAQPTGVSKTTYNWVVFRPVVAENKGDTRGFRLSTFRQFQILYNRFISIIACTKLLSLKRCRIGSPCLLRGLLAKAADWRPNNIIAFVTLSCYYRRLPRSLCVCLSEQKRRIRPRLDLKFFRFWFTVAFHLYLVISI